LGHSTTNPTTLKGLHLDDKHLLFNPLRVVEIKCVDPEQALWESGQPWAECSNPFRIEKQASRRVFQQVGLIPPKTVKSRLLKIIFAVPINSGIMLKWKRHWAPGSLKTWDIGNGSQVVEFRQRPFSWLGWGRTRIATQVVDFHGNSG
jgi:hypothetical protein